MEAMSVIAGILVGALLVYLFIAMLRPEMF